MATVAVALAALLAVGGCGSSESGDLELTAGQKKLVTQAITASRRLGEMEGIREAVDDVYAIQRRINHASETSSSFEQFGLKMVSVMRFLNRRIRDHRAQIDMLKKQADTGRVKQLSEER